MTKTMSIVATALLLTTAGCNQTPATTETAAATRTRGRPRRWFVAHELLALLVR